jgi:hypothetical protein
MPLSREERSARGRAAVQARWSKSGDEGKRKQRLIMLEAQAKGLGYRLVPVEDNEDNTT